MKGQLLHNLNEEIYCRLAPSKIHGVGVIAIRPIPRGIDPYRTTIDNCREDKVVYLSPAEVNNLAPRVRKLVKDFFFPTTDGQYAVYAKGPNALDISFYMNNSKDANIELVSVPGCPYYEFRTKRNIKAGEELTIPYKN